MFSTLRKLKRIDRHDFFYLANLTNETVYNLGYNMGDDGVTTRPNLIEALKCLDVVRICTTNSQWIVLTRDGIVYEQARRQKRFYRVILDNSVYSTDMIMFA
jgi:hypothetical protein